MSLLTVARRLSSRLPGPWDRRSRELGKAVINYRGARRNALRAIGFAIAARRSEFLLVKFGEGHLVVDSQDQEIGRGVYIRGDYERIYMHAAIDYLSGHTDFSPAGKTFIDVGANIGTSTVDALLHFGFAGAVCFEPDPRNFRLLRANLWLNDLDARATCFQLAASDTDGIASLLLNSINSGDHRIVGRRAEQSRSDRIQTVSCARIDTLVNAGEIDLEQTGLVWLDTQGHEPAVLSGAKSILRAGIPVVIEYWPTHLRATESLEQLEQLISSHYGTVVDLRLLSHGLESEAVLSSDRIAEMRSRYTGDELTDLLLLK